MVRVVRGKLTTARVCRVRMVVFVLMVLATSSVGVHQATQTLCVAPTLMNALAGHVGITDPAPTSSMDTHANVPQVLRIHFSAHTRERAGLQLTWNIFG